MKLSNKMRKYLAEIGRKGGKTTSPAKSEASRLNGLNGGRPRKEKTNDPT
jgi:general stress protein YciG